MQVQVGGQMQEAEMIYIAHAKVADTPGPGEEWSLLELESDYKLNHLSFKLFLIILGTPSQNLLLRKYQLSSGIQTVNFSHILQPH